MAGKNKLTDQKAIDAIVDSIFKVAGTSRKQAPATGKNEKDGKDAPQINDDEALSTNPWSGLKTQEEIAKVEGKIYPCTSQALEAMSQEQQAELYVQGYRAIKTENNGTVVLLGLAADGSLEWLGCNQPRGNLLDNPNFSVAQAGYGGLHGTQVYAADRWKGSGTGATFAAGSGGGLAITCGTGTAGCSQVIADPPDVGEYFSFVVVSGNTTVIASGVWTGTAQDATATSGTLTATVNAGSVKISVAIGSATVDYCMLLDGSYTPKTLPPWESPDYATEYLKCLRYYRALASYGRIVFKPCGEVAVTIVSSDEMRVLPTAVTVDLQIFDGTAIWVPATVDSVTWMGDGYKIRFNVDGTISNGENYLMQGLTGLTADL